jgi:hypothetical protein
MEFDVTKITPVAKNLVRARLAVVGTFIDVGKQSRVAS